MMAFYSTWEELRLQQIRRLHRHGHAAGDDPLRGGALLAGSAADLRLDAHQRAFARCSCAGARWRRSTISTARRRCSSRRRRSACFRREYWRRLRPIMNGLRRQFRRADLALGADRAGRSGGPCRTCGAGAERGEGAFPSRRLAAGARRLYVLDHLEYDATSLADEYFRDVKAHVPIQLPHAPLFPRRRRARTPAAQPHGARTGIC